MESKHLEDFDSEEGWVDYLKSALLPGRVVWCPDGFESVSPGEKGTFVFLDAEADVDGLDLFVIEWENSGICGVPGFCLSLTDASDSHPQVAAPPSGLGSETFKSILDYSGIEEFYGFIKDNLISNQSEVMLVEDLSPDLHYGLTGTFVKAFSEGDDGYVVETKFPGMESMPLPLQVIAVKTGVALASVSASEQKLNVAILEAPTIPLSWKSKESFASEGDYVQYMKSTVQKGFVVKLTRNFDDLALGDTGVVVNINNRTPPCQVRWNEFGACYWTRWEDLEIVSGFSAEWMYPYQFPNLREYHQYLLKVFKPELLVLSIRDLPSGIKSATLGHLVEVKSSAPDWKLAVIRWIDGTTTSCLIKDFVIVEFHQDRLAQILRKVKTYIEEIDAMGPPWKTYWDFETGYQYVTYLKSIVKPGFKFMAVRTYQKVLEGEFGEYVQYNENFPPCQCKWRDYGSTYWVYWRDIMPVDGYDEADCKQLLAEFNEIAASKPKYPWKKLADFSDDAAYDKYLRETLVPGMKILCTKEFNGVEKDDTGEFLGISGNPVSPCKGYWNKGGRVVEVPFSHIVNIEGQEDEWKSLIGTITGPPWKTFSDFENEIEYSNYLKAALKPGMAIKCSKSYESVCAGDIGKFTQWNGLTPPCQVDWKILTTTYWMWWKDIQIVEGIPEAAFEVPTFVPGPPYKKLKDFENEALYSAYLKQVLKKGMTLRCVNTYESVNEGDEGEFVQFNANWPPCQVSWSEYGSTYWLFWRDLEIVDSSEADKELEGISLTGPPWKSLQDFKKPKTYVSYLKAVLKPGMTVMCTKSFEPVCAGDVGSVVTYNTGTPPVQVNWKGLGTTYWMHFNALKLVSGTEEEKYVEEVFVPGPPYKTFADFPDENAYASYLKKTLTPGKRVRCVNTYESVSEGDWGTFVQYNQSWPPCQISWTGYGSTYWMFWRDIEILEDDEDEEEAVGPPWKSLEDLHNDSSAYTSYLMKFLKPAGEHPASQVICIRSYQPVMQGDVGEFIQYNSGQPPVQISWKGLGTTYWVPWTSIKIITGTSLYENFIKSESLPLGAPWKGPADFSSEVDYAQYMKKNLTKGMKILCLHTYEVVAKGDTGSYVQHNESWPPCQVNWKNKGGTYWMFWRDIRIIEGLSEPEVTKILEEVGYKQPHCYETDNEYGDFNKSIAVAGAKVRLRKTYEVVIGEKD